MRDREPTVPLAGATDLYVRHRRGGGLPPKMEHPLLYIAHLRELQGVEVGEREIRIGAAAVYTDILNEPAVPEILRASIRELAAPALRNAGTIGGNICNASPAADAVCALYALDTRCEIRSVNGSRVVPLDEFVTGPGKTILQQNELLTAITFPRTNRRHTLYHKVGTRGANALSKLSIAAEAEVSDGQVKDVAIALGAVAPTVLRLRQLEKELLGPVDDLPTRADRVYAGYAEAISPIDDQRSTAEYRREVAVNLVREFVEERLLAPEAYQVT